MPDHLLHLKEMSERDYSSARVHLAWMTQIKKTFHVMAIVELLPQEVPPDPSLSPESRAIGNTGWNVGYRRISASASDALFFFESCLAGSVFNFDGSGTIQRRKVASVVLPQLEPPRLRCPENGEEEKLPYLANWHVCPKVYEALPKPPIDLQSIFPEHQLPKVYEWFEEKLHVDLHSYPEYAGGVIVIAPNPVFRTVKKRLYVDNGAETESVALLVQPRSGQTTEELTAIYAEKETGTRFETKFTKNLAVFHLNHSNKLFAIEIRCPKRGLLFRKPPTPIIRSVNLGVAVHSADIRMHVKDEVSGKEKEILGEKVEVLPSLVIGYSQNDDSQNAEVRRRRKQEGIKYQQCWFGGSEQKSATDYVLAVLNSAAKEAFIVDPYFGCLDLVQYLFSNNNWSVKINILTSAAFLKNPRDKEEPISEEGEVLLQTYNGLLDRVRRSNIGTPNVTIRVMLGEKSPIHDRFLTADNEVWMVGASLNELGSRGTMVLKLPDPWLVLPVITDEWVSAKDLADWVADRQKKKDKSIRRRDRKGICVLGWISSLCRVLGLERRNHNRK